MEDITNCTLSFDEKTSTVTVRSKFGTDLLKIKLEAASAGTMRRVNPYESCDNYWIGVKPSDSTVFNDILFGDCQLAVKSIDFSLNGGRDRKRRGLE